MGRITDYEGQAKYDKQAKINKKKAEKKAKNAKKCFNNRLSRLFSDSNLTQHQVEFGTGISRNTFKQYISKQSRRDYSESKIGNLAVLADYFNVSTDYLLGNTKIKSSDFKVRRISELTGLNENTVSFFIRHSKIRKEREKSKSKKNQLPPIPLFIDYMINNGSLNSSFFSMMETVSEIIEFNHKLEDDKKKIKKMDNFDEESYFDDVRQIEKDIRFRLSMNIFKLVDGFIDEITGGKLRKED